MELAYDSCLLVREADAIQCAKDPLVPQRQQTRHFSLEPATHSVGDLKTVARQNLDGSHITRRAPDLKDLRRAPATYRTHDGVDVLLAREHLPGLKDPSLRAFVGHEHQVYPLAASYMVDSLGRDRHTRLSVGVWRDRSTLRDSTP
jgi:hypothetical protein